MQALVVKNNALLINIRKNNYYTVFVQKLMIYFITFEIIDFINLF